MRPGGERTKAVAWAEGWQHLCQPVSCTIKVFGFLLHAETLSNTMPNPRP